MIENMYNDFKWPVPVGETTMPKWCGNYFTLTSGSNSGVLICNDSNSNWSDDLTLLHEAEAGQGDHPIDQASRELAIRSLRDHLADSSSVIMDVGCSSGFLLSDIKRSFPQAALIGADYLTDLLLRLSQKMPQVPLLQFDLRKSPLETECIDAITCINVLEHIDDDRAALGEIYRMLKPGGIAHIEVPASPSCYDIYDEHLMHHRRYTMRELSMKCQQAGFSILNKTHLGALVFPAFYVVKKRNRKYLKCPKEVKSNMVKKMISQTRSSILMRIISKAEMEFGKYFSYPFGIRAVIVVQKYE